MKKVDINIIHEINNVNDLYIIYDFMMCELEYYAANPEKIFSKPQLEMKRLEKELREHWETYSTYKTIIKDTLEKMQIEAAGYINRYNKLVEEK